MSDVSEHVNPYQCGACFAPIPSNRSQSTCPKCHAPLSADTVAVIASGARVEESSPVRQVGWVAAIVGFVGLGVAGLVYNNLDDQERRKSMDALFAIGGGSFHEKSWDAGRLRDKKDKVIPWAIGSGALGVVGIGLILAGGSPITKRKCPKCAELVMQEAVICKHCGSELSA